MADLVSPPAWKSLLSRRAAAKVLSRLPRRAAAAPPHLSSLRRRAVSEGTRRVPRELGRIQHQKAEKILKARAEEAQEWLLAREGAMRVWGRTRWGALCRSSILMTTR